MSRFINTEQIFFLDNGEPNALGTVYFGEPNQDAKTNPKVPYLDEALTTPATATQSLSAGGKLSSTLWLDGDYSMIVDDSFGAQVDEDLSLISGQADAAGISLTVNSLSRASVQSYLENAQVPDYATLIANAAQYADGDVVEVVRRQAGQEGGGSFLIVEDDLSAEAATDPEQGVYVELVAGLKYAVRIGVLRALTRDFGTIGDGLTDNSLGIDASNSATGNTSVLDLKTYAVASTIALNRYSSLISTDDQSWPRSNILWTGAAAGTVIKTEPNQTYAGLTIDGNSLAGEGVRLGDDAVYKAYINIDRDWIKNCDVGLQVSNVFDAKVSQVRLSGNRIGASIDPVDFGSDGGYTTTLHFDRAYITDNTEEGLINNAPVKNKMFTISHSVFEKNGDASHPQISLGEGQPNSIYNVYIEDATDTATAIEISDGYIQSAYINGFSKGIDLGGGNSSILLDNIKFASGGGPSVTSSGGSLANYAGMRRCEFSGTPTLDSRVQIYEGCSGDMPAGVPEHSWVMTGAKPQHGIGTTPAITRDIEAWLHNDAGAVISANSSYTFDIDLPVGRMADNFSSITVTPQERLDPATNDLTWSVIRVNTLKARVVVSNPTGGALTLDPLNWLLRMEQFTVINGETGEHDGGGNSATLNNSNSSWTINEHVGRTLANITDGSSGVITANTATTITAVLSGGTDNDWDTGDKYRISNF